MNNPSVNVCSQDGHTVHTTPASDPGIRAGVRDEAVHRAVLAVPAAAHVLRLPAAVRPVLDRCHWRRLRGQHQRPVLMIVAHAPGRTVLTAFGNAKCK